MKNKKIYVLIACLAVVLTGCGLNLEKKAATPEAVKETAVVNEVATSSKEVLTAIEKSISLSSATTSTVRTGDWQIYTNHKYGFELKVPKAYLVKEEEGGGSLRFYHPSVEILYKSVSETKYTKIEGGELFVKPTNNNYQDFLKTIKDSNRSSENILEKNVNINNATAVWTCFDYGQSYLGNAVCYLFVNGNNGYNFIMNSGGGMVFAEEEGAIKSTFKLIE